MGRHHPRVNPTTPASKTLILGTPVVALVLGVINPFILGAAILPGIFVMIALSGVANSIDRMIMRRRWDMDEHEIDEFYAQRRKHIDAEERARERERRNTRTRVYVGGSLGGFYFSRRIR